MGRRRVEKRLRAPFLTGASAARVLHVYYMCTVRVLHVYCTCTARALHVYCTCTARVLYAPQPDGDSEAELHEQVLHVLAVDPALQVIQT